MPTLKENDVLKWINKVCLTFFTIEFVLRVIVCPRKIQFIKDYKNWIDFLSIIPSYLTIAFPHNKWMYNLVIIRLLRVFKFFKLSYGLQVLLHTLKASSYELTLLLLILLIPLVVFSSLVYAFEFTGTDGITDFDSIPRTFWWTIVTMTTVGYGDMAPKTWVGQVIGSLCAIISVLIIALPISVIGNNFNLYYSHVRARLKLPKKNRHLLQGRLRGLLRQPAMLSSRDRDRKNISRRSGAGSLYMTGGEKNLSVMSAHSASTVQNMDRYKRRAREGVVASQISLAESSTLSNESTSLSHSNYLKTISGGEAHQHKKVSSQNEGSPVKNLEYGFPSTTCALKKQESNQSSIDAKKVECEEGRNDLQKYKSNTPSLSSCNNEDKLDSRSLNMEIGCHDPRNDAICGGEVQLSPIFKRSKSERQGRPSRKQVFLSPQLQRSRGQRQRKRTVNLSGEYFSPFGSSVSGNDDDDCFDSLTSHQFRDRSDHRMEEQDTEGTCSACLENTGEGGRGLLLRNDDIEKNYDTNNNEKETLEQNKIISPSSILSSFGRENSNEEARCFADACSSFASDESLVLPSVSLTETELKDHFDCYNRFPETPIIYEDDKNSSPARDTSKQIALQNGDSNTDNIKDHTKESSPFLKVCGSDTNNEETVTRRESMRKMTTVSFDGAHRWRAGSFNETPSTLKGLIRKISSPPMLFGYNNKPNGVKEVILPTPGNSSNQMNGKTPYCNGEDQSKTMGKNALKRSATEHNFGGKLLLNTNETKHSLSIGDITKLEEALRESGV